MDDGYIERYSRQLILKEIGGPGQNLLSKFENNVREKGINTITLTTDADSNHSVIKFYKKSGYKVYYEFVTFPNRKMLKLLKKI